MKKTLVSVALFALMTTGFAYADNSNANARARDNAVWSVSCDYGSIGCEADARIALSSAQEQAVENGTAQPAWFGNLLAVACKGVLISASDATLYSLTGDAHGFVWDIDNSDATVHVLMKDHPFHDHGPNTVESALEIGNGFAPGTCTSVRVH